MDLRTGFTLIEITLVMVIIGILAAMAIPSFIRSIEEGKNREAVAALRLIRTAERLYYLDYDKYISASDTSEVNTKLDLDIESQNWRFWVNVENSPPDFTAYAERTLTARRRTFRISSENPNVECHEDTCCCYSWPKW